MLLTSGRISKEQFRASTFALLDNPKKRHGQILFEMGLISEGELRQAVLEQVQRIVWGLFAVTSGKATFSLGDYAAEEVYKLRIPTPRAILHGCKTVPDAKPMIVRMGGKNTVFFLAPSPEHLQELELEPAEEELLGLIDGRRTFFELCEQGPFSAGLNARVLYGFLCLGLIVRERDPGSGIHVHVPSTSTGA
jgi:hypothetical protein